MPPKRKQQDPISSGSEPDIVNLHRPPATSLPAIMRNIGTLRTKRDSGRSKIISKFDAYMSEKEKELSDYYASEAKKKSAEAKDLMNRYVEALERRASIEKAIEGVVKDARQDLEGLNIILKAAYSGRQQKLRAAIGTFSSIATAQTKNTTSANPTNSHARPDTNGKAMTDRGEAESRACNEEPGFVGKESIFDQISW